MSDERRGRWNGSWPLLHWVVGGIKSPRRPAYCWLSTIGSPKSDPKKLVTSPHSIGPIHTQCDAASMPSCWEAKNKFTNTIVHLGVQKKRSLSRGCVRPESARGLCYYAMRWSLLRSRNAPPSYPGGGGAMEDESGGGGGASGLIQDLCSPKARTPLKNGTPSVHVTVPEPTQDQVMRGGHLFDISFLRIKPVWFGEIC